MSDAHHSDPLSLRLRRDKERVLKLWEERVRACVPAARSLDSLALRNSLPKLIDELIKTLNDPESEGHLEKKETQLAREHGEERSKESSYDLVQMLEEYQVLRKVVFEVLRAGGPISDQQTDIILDAITIGIRNATAEFVRLKQEDTSKSLKRINEVLKQAENAEQTAAAAKQELHDLIMQAPVAMVLFNGPDHRFVIANPQYEKFVGRKVVGKTVLEAFSQDEVGYFVPLLDAVYKTGEAHLGSELPFTIPDAAGVAQTHFVNLGYYPFRDGEGKIVGVSAVVQDVSEQVEARKAAEVSEAQARLQRERAEIATSLGGIGIVDLNVATGKIQLPETIAELYELTPGVHDVDECFNRLHPDDRERVKAIMSKAAEQNLDFDFETRILPTSGKLKWLRATGKAILGEKGESIAIIGLNVDITEQKRAEEQIAQATTALEAAKYQAEQANQAKSSFLANMSHEIRTPMTAVLGFSEVLKDPELSVDERADAVSRIENSGRGLLRLIDDVLDISKIEAGKLNIQNLPFAPAAVASEVVTLLKLTAESKGLQLRFRIDKSCPDIACSDAARLRQILINLVGNAIKFTSQGEVTLIVRAESNKFVVFDVCDTGIGVSRDDQEKLFKPFAQADDSISRTFGGTGLGLILSQRLADRMGGGLWLESSEKGKGSHFIAKVMAAPFSNELNPTIAENQSARIAVSSRVELAKLRVLVAEDAPDNRVLMQRYLSSVGAKVDFATNGAEAIERAMTEEFDVVLMDIQMPVVDGLQATRTLRSSGYKKPILALTAHAMSEEVERSIKAGCNDHLTKPITKSVLVESILRNVEAVAIDSRN